MDADTSESSSKNSQRPIQIAVPTPSLSMPRPSDDEFLRPRFLHPVNIDIVITPCDGTLESPYEQTALMTKMVKSHKRMVRNHHRKLNWLCSFVNERRLRNAATNKDITEVKTLIEKDSEIDLNSCDDKKRTALHISAANGTDDILRTLLENGANPNVKDVKGNTPLHLAACAGKVPIVTLLLHHGADISATDFNGKTPLHLALARLQVFQKSQISKSRYDYLKRRAQIKDIADLLKEYLHRTGSEKEKSDIMMLSSKLSDVSTEQEVIWSCLTTSEPVSN